MDCGYFSDELLDLQWNDILKKYLDSFSCQNKKSQLTFDQILKLVFSTDQADNETKYEDKELFEKCVAETLSLLSAATELFKPSKLLFILHMMKHMLRDETCFINLNMNGSLYNALYMCQLPPISTNKLFKILFAELIRSTLHHQTGIKWTVESQFWMNVYNNSLEFQEDKDIAELGYIVLTELLGKITEIDETMCEDIIRIIITPLINADIQLTIPNTFTAPSMVRLDNRLKPSLLCLINILERLLENSSEKVLNKFINLKVGVISDQLSQKITEKQLCLVLERICILLSFFGLTEIFDGIKSISQDPLVLSGFLRIIDHEIQKGDLSIAIELYYYGIKYTKSMTNKLPRYTMKGNILDIESELLALQLEPIILVAEKLQNFFNSPEKVETLRVSHLAQLLKRCSLQSLKIGFKIKHLLPTYPTEIFPLALEGIAKTKNLYSPGNLGAIFECLIYSFDDLLNYIRINCGCLTMTPNQETYVRTLFSTVLLFIEDFDFSWGDGVKALDLPQIMYDFLSSFSWTNDIIVKGLILMEQSILKRLSPCMSLLIDTPESLKDIGPMLYRKCFMNDWEIRKAVLDVVCTIAYNANKSFSSFREVLTEASLPSLVSTMALNDENPTVKATAFKCLQQMINIEDMDHPLRTKYYINKVLDTISKYNNPAVQSEAINFVDKLYFKEDALPKEMIASIYTCMEQTALYCNEVEVQKAAVTFWENVARKMFRSQGWMDQKFPSVIFSKKVVVMTKKECRIRIHKILTELSHNGCLNVFSYLYESENVHPEILETISKFLEKLNIIVFQKYDITPESMMVLNSASEQNCNRTILPETDLESDHVLEDVLNSTMIPMFSDDINFCSNEDIFSVLENSSSFPNRRTAEYYKHRNSQIITPSEFVAFVIRKMSTDVQNDSASSESGSLPKSNDLYNIIDY